MIPKNIYHYTIQGYESANERLELFDVSIIQLTANSAEEALELAKSILTKKFYRISNIVVQPNPIAQVEELNEKTIKQIKKLNAPPRQPWQKPDEEDEE